MCLATFDFPFYGVSQAKAEPLRKALENTVAAILEVDEKEVTAVIGSDLGHADVDFFIEHPSEETRKMCESGEMPPKLLRALTVDDKVAPLLESSKGMCINLFYFFQNLRKCLQN